MEKDTKDTAVSALKMLDPKLKTAKPQPKPAKAVRKISKRELHIFSEKPCKRVSLKFLNLRFKSTIKDSVKINKTNFFNLLTAHMNAVRLSNNRITFCKTVGDKTVDIIFVNYNNLKPKYKKLCTKLLDGVVINFDGLITDKKLITDLMELCQGAYIRSYDHDRKDLVPERKKVLAMKKIADKTKVVSQMPAGASLMDH